MGTHTSHYLVLYHKNSHWHVAKGTIMHSHCTYTTTQKHNTPVLLQKVMCSAAEGKGMHVCVCGGGGREEKVM